MISVQATREGLVGKMTATGTIITARLPFVALPSVRALGRFVRLFNPKNGRTAFAFVDDVGPWNETDHGYVFQTATRPGSTWGGPTVRPAAESGTDTRGRKTNGAGIDLSECIWGKLLMLDNGPVLWEFLD